jgi:hypothetical protein
MVVNPSNSAQDVAANLQELLQSSSKQNGSAKTANASESIIQDFSNASASTPGEAQSSELFSPLNMLTDTGSDLSETDAAQLTELLSRSMASNPAGAQAAQSNQIPQSVLNLLQ